MGDEQCFVSLDEYPEYADAVLAALPKLMGRQTSSRRLDQPAITTKEQ